MVRVTMEDCIRRNAYWFDQLIKVQDSKTIIDETYEDYWITWVPIKRRQSHNDVDVRVTWHVVKKEYDENED